jgi:SSS family solute:Na+ symporter
VNAPLFAIFLLGMWWRRATGHGSFWGLLIGTTCAAIFHGLTIPVGETAWIKGGWLVGADHARHFASSMAQNFWMAIFAFLGCLIGTFVISLATAQNRTDDELRGLVYSLTAKPHDDPNAAWYSRPVVLGVIVLVAAFALNIIFW